MLIYVVDGDAEWGKLVAEALEGVAETEVFVDGMEAIAAMDEKVPNGVVCAVELVGPNGFSLLQEMRSYKELIDVPVLMLSDMELGDVKAYGVTAVLDRRKMDPRELVREVKKWT